MCFEDLLHSLPNGLHDAELHEACVNFTRLEARLSLSIWIGDLESDDTNIREAYRPAILLLTGLHYWVPGLPDFKLLPLKKGPAIIDVGPINSIRATQEIPPLPPTSDQAYWLYSSQTNSLSFFSSAGALLTWLPE